MKPQLSDPRKGYEYFKDKMAYTLGPAELKHWIDDREDINIVDVRREEDYQKGHIPGAVSLPQDRWGGREGLKKDKVNVLYCYTQQCHLAPEAAVEFAKDGYSCMELEGGFDVWSKYHMPVQSLAAAR